MILRAFLYWLDPCWGACLIAFISVFFTSRKTAFHCWLDTSSIPVYLSSFSSIFLIAISTPLRHLVDQSRKFLSPRYLLDTFSCRRVFFSTPTSIPTSTPLDTSAVENYWSFYLSSCRNPIFICSICPWLFLSQTPFFSLKSSNPLDFRSSLGFNHLVRSLFPSCFMHCMF